MGTILGPFDEGDWLTMLLLKGDILEMQKKENKELFKPAIRMQTKTLKKYMTKCES